MNTWNDFIYKRRLWCGKCHAWTEHSVRPVAQMVTCLSCGDERRAGLSELATKPPEAVPITRGKPERA